MYNMDKEQTAIKTLVTGTYDSLNQINSTYKMTADHVNL